LERGPRPTDQVLDLFSGVTDGATFGRKQVGYSNHTAQLAYRLLRRLAIQIPVNFAQKSHMPFLGCYPNGVVADLPSKDAAGSLCDLSIGIAAKVSGEFDLLCSLLAVHDASSVQHCLTRVFSGH